MNAEPSSSPTMHTSAPVPIWPSNILEPCGRGVAAPYYSADKVRRILRQNWQQISELHDSGALPMERLYGNLVVHEDDALRFCGPEELSNDETDLWDETQVEGELS
jgi:hypothetical protein